jgi:hypothetical protein
MGNEAKERIKPGPAGHFTAELGEAFLALLRQTGNARASARMLGHRHLFYNRMYRDPDFRRRCVEALAVADAALAGREGEFVGPLEFKSVPPDEGDPLGTGRPLAIRKTSNGRTQIGHIREGAWTAQIEDDLLDRLRRPGNLRWSARAAGVDPSSVYKRMEKYAAFADKCREALNEAETRLDYELVAHAHTLLRRPGEPRGQDEPEHDGTPFDPDGAMRILAFIDRRRNGATNRGRRHKGPPERSFEEAVESVLAKIDAIERHRQRQAAQQNSPPSQGGGGGGRD